MYISGRIRKRTGPKSAQVLATEGGRRLAKLHLANPVRVTVTSKGTADPATLAHQMRTVISFPEQNSDALAEAITALPGYVGMIRDRYSITYRCSLED